jgi:hypothetical protein
VCYPPAVGDIDMLGIDNDTDEWKKREAFNVARASSLDGAITVPAGTFARRSELAAWMIVFLSVCGGH